MASRIWRVRSGSETCGRFVKTNKMRASWEFVVSDENNRKSYHVIETEYSFTSGKRKTKLDGQKVHRSKRPGALNPRLREVQVFQCGMFKAEIATGRANGRFRCAFRLGGILFHNLPPLRIHSWPIAQPHLAFDNTLGDFVEATAVAVHCESNCVGRKVAGSKRKITFYFAFLKDLARIHNFSIAYSIFNGRKQVFFDGRQISDTRNFQLAVKYDKNFRCMGHHLRCMIRETSENFITRLFIDGVDFSHLRRATRSELQERVNQLSGGIENSAEVINENRLKNNRAIRPDLEVDEDERREESIAAAARRALQVTEQREVSAYGRNGVPDLAAAKAAAYAALRGQDQDSDVPGSPISVAARASRRRQSSGLVAEQGEQFDPFVALENSERNSDLYTEDNTISENETAGDKKNEFSAAENAEALFGENDDANLDVDAWAMEFDALASNERELTSRKSLPDFGSAFTGSSKSNEILMGPQVSMSRQKSMIALPPTPEMARGAFADREENQAPESPDSPFVSKNKALRGRMQARLQTRFTERQAPNGIGAGIGAEGPFQKPPQAPSVARREQRRARRGRSSMTLESAFSYKNKNGTNNTNPFVGVDSAFSDVLV
eukprot:g1937.t1